MSPNRCTIKSILSEIQKEVTNTEKYNYLIAKKVYEDKHKKGPSQTFAYNKDLNNDLGIKSQKGDNLYMYYSNLGKTIFSKETNKDVQIESSKLLHGVYSPKVEGNTFQFSKTRSMVDLKRTGSSIVSGNKTPHDPINQKMMMRQLNDLLKSRKGNRQYNRSSLGTLPQTTPSAITPTSPNDMLVKHFPTRRLDQNKIMFNEIFVKPKMDQLKQLEYQRAQEFKRLKLPSIKESKTTVIEKEEAPDTDFVRDTLIKDRQNKLKELNKNDKSLEISSLIERRRFNKNTDSLFGEDEEDAFKKIEKADIEEIKEEEIKKLIVMKSNQNANNPNKPQYEFHNYNIQSTIDHEEEENNDIIRVIMKSFNSNAKSKSSGSFFTQQIQVQPPEGLINMIGSEGSWAPSIPLSNTSMNKSISKAKGKERSLNDTSLQDIKMRAKAGVQAGDVKKEAHMAFCLGSLNEDKNITKSIRYYKRFFFCARILEDPVGAALALNRLGVAYHKIKNYDKSLMFHMKHKEYTDKENLFAAYYNLGVSQRLLKRNEDAVQSFTKALEWATLHQELDSECFCNGQLGITELIRGNQEVASKHLNICLDIAKMLKNKRLELDCLLCLGYILFSKGEFEESKNYFSKAYKTAKNLKESEIAEQCLCNVGISIGNIQVITMQKELKSTMSKSIPENVNESKISETQSEFIEGDPMSEVEAETEREYLF